MGYENGRAGKTGRLGEKEAIRFLDSHGYSAVKPSAKDIGDDLGNVIEEAYYAWRYSAWFDNCILSVRN